MAKDKASLTDAQWYSQWMENNQKMFAIVEENFQHFLKNNHASNDTFPQHIAAFKENIKKEWEKIVDEKLKEAQWQHEQTTFSTYWHCLTDIFEKAIDETMRSFSTHVSHFEGSGLQEKNGGMALTLENIHAFQKMWVKNFEKMYQQAIGKTAFQEIYGNMIADTLANWHRYTKA